MDSSFIFSFLRVLPEPNLQESDEGRDSHHSFLAYEPLWTCTVRGNFLPLANNNAKNIMDMSEELKSNALLDSQVVE